MISYVTGSAVALHCCKAHERINTKRGNSTPCKIVTPENFSSNVCTHDYVGDGNYCANFCENRFSGGFSPNRWNINTFVTFLTVLSCPVLFSRSCAQVEPLDRFSRFMAQTTCSAQGGAFGGYNDRWRHLGKICPQNSLKVGVNRQFQAKMPKYENCSISKTANPIKPKFDDKADTTNTNTRHLHVITPKV